MNTAPQVLYIVYWGAGEPLGQSLVLPSVKKLAALGVKLTLVTFEKPADLARREEMAQTRAALAQHSVRWIPLGYHKRPKVPATAFDLLQGCARSLLARLNVRPDIIHARTFIGGLMGMALAPLLGARLIYHNEGFYPDEQVDGGVWAAGSVQHRLARYLERRMYARADGIIALSRRARRVIENLPEVERKGTPVIVVPSCVDLEHFRWPPPQPSARRDKLSFVYSGSVGGRYLLDKIGRLVALVAQAQPSHLRVVTRSDPRLAAELLGAGGLPAGLWSVASVPYAAMPDELAQHQVGLHFMPRGVSECGGSPTKIGEYWAAGLPVVVTPEAGDTDEIIRRERVGVIVSEHSDDAYHRAAQELQLLLEEKALSQRCRRAAEIHYALGPACERQAALYQSLAPHLDRATITVHLSKAASR